MLLSMLELLYSPFVLLLISNKSGNSISGSRKDPPLSILPPTTGNSDARPSPPNVSCNRTFLFYDHPNSTIRGCYDEGGKEPCWENMRIYSINGTRNGECDCDSFSERILVYHKETNRCYPIYQQGYCKPGQWIVITRESFPDAVCERNFCYEEAQQSPNMKGKDLVPLSNGSCVEVGSQCEVHITKDEVTRGIISFKSDKLVPECSPRMKLKAVFVGASRCSQGLYRTSTGHCQKPVDWFD